MARRPKHDEQAAPGDNPPSDGSVAPAADASQADTPQGETLPSDTPQPNNSAAPDAQPPPTGMTGTDADESNSQAASRTSEPGEPVTAPSVLTTLNVPMLTVQGGNSMLNKSLQVDKVNIKAENEKLSLKVEKPEFDKQTLKVEHKDGKEKPEKFETKEKPEKTEHKEKPEKNEHKDSKFEKHEHKEFAKDIEKVQKDVDKLADNLPLGNPVAASQNAFTTAKITDKILDGKHFKLEVKEKLEKTEHKEKPEKIEQKEVKFEKIEHKDKIEKLEHKEINHEVNKQFSAEKPTDTPPIGDPTGPITLPGGQAFQPQAVSKSIFLETTSKHVHKDFHKSEFDKFQHKEFIKEKEFKEKDIFDTPVGPIGPIGPVGPGPVEQRLAWLEQAVNQLSHFITQNLRPDLSGGALTREQDVNGQNQIDPAAVSQQLQQAADAAKQAKDNKDVEKLLEG